MSEDGACEHENGGMTSTRSERREVVCGGRTATLALLAWLSVVAPRAGGDRGSGYGGCCGSGREARLAVAAGTDGLLGPKTRHLARRAGGIPAQVRSGVVGIDVRRRRDVHQHPLQDRRLVRAHLFWPGPSSPDGVRRRRPDQQRLRGLPRHRLSAVQRGSPQGVRGALLVSRLRRLVHRRAGDQHQLFRSSRPTPWAASFSTRSA
jgi:hypothetical protein